MSVKAVGVGDPVTDIIVDVSPEELRSVTDEPGGSLCVGSDESELLLSKLQGTATAMVRLPGGSAANVMTCLSKFCPPKSCTFTGGIGRDDTSRRYRELLQAQGVEPQLVETSDTEPSATSVCMVTPDGQRTMRTCLGAAMHYGPEHLPQSLAGCNLLHFEGYCLYKPSLVKTAIATVKQSNGNALVSLDMASFEVVRNCKDALTEILASGLVDILFCNEDEALALAPLVTPELHLGGDAPRDAWLPPVQEALLKHCKTVVCTLGAQGAQAQSSTHGFAEARACSATVVDTVGAGDYFCGAFLAAFVRGALLEECLVAGCTVGGQVVQQVGAQLPEETWAALRGELAGVMRLPLTHADRAFAVRMPEMTKVA